MHKRGISADVSPYSSSLIAFKPRQVLLKEQRQGKSSAEPARMVKKQTGKPAQLKPGADCILTYSVALWLKNKGFNKALKRFLSAAQIQDDDWNARALDLNEIFSMYQQICNDVREDLGSQKQERVVDSSKQIRDTNCSVSLEIEIQKKKKNGADIAVTETERARQETMVVEKVNEPNVHDKKEKKCKISDPCDRDQKSKASEESGNEKVCELPEVQYVEKQKDKKKKKSKSTLESHDAKGREIDAMPGVTEEKQEHSVSKSSDGKDNTEVVVESKNKKKKKMLKTDNNLVDEKDLDLENENKFVATKDASGIQSEDNHVQVEKKMRKKEATIPAELSISGAESKKTSVEAAEDGIDDSKKTSKKRKHRDPDENVNQLGQDIGVEDRVDESKKASKKRKHMDPDENANQPDLDAAVEESKHKKAKALEESKDVPEIALNGHAHAQNKEEKFQVGLAGSQNISAKLAEESTDGYLNSNGAKKLSQPKSARKQRNNSAEPKTVNAFQRVKVDEVEFTDERLQDNSYWAKDGAEKGYGAKAQEVLGQVKGRDFRHEKTKKKRGSYRGGQIDFHSHSIKFNYSDED